MLLQYIVINKSFLLKALHIPSECTALCSCDNIIFTKLKINFCLILSEFSSKTFNIKAIKKQFVLDYNELQWPE